MCKLLSAGFSRLWKSKVFWLGIILMLGIGVCLILDRYYLSLLGYEVSVNSMLFAGAMLVSVFAPVFCSLFFGTEFSDGTIRNKLIVGHRRHTIYFSTLILSTGATSLMCLAYTAVAVILGIPLLGYKPVGAPALAGLIFGSILVICAICALLTALCMLVQSKSHLAVISIVLVLVLWFAAITIQQRLAEPEFYEEVYLSMYEDGVTPDISEPMPNPNYFTGDKRKTYQAVLDILPTGQAVQIANMRAENLQRFPLYSLVIILVTTAGGLVLFRKKDIK